MSDIILYAHTGLHFIPLRTPNGESTPHVGIFVKIKMDKLSQKQASSSGTCSLQDLNSPKKGQLSSSKLFETCNLSLDQIEEDTTAIEEFESPTKEEKTANICSLSDSVFADGNSAHVPSKKQPKISRQDAIIEFTVELRSSSSDDI